MLGCFKTKSLWMGVLLAFLGFSRAAFAGDNTQTPAKDTKPVAAAVADVKVVYEKKTVIDLSGAVIEGELTKPEGSYIVNRKVSRFSSLIKVREHFLPELLSSAERL